jgi:hypothetical protein
MELEEEPALMLETRDVAKVAIHAGNRFSTVEGGACGELLTSELAFTRNDFIAEGVLGHTRLQTHTRLSLPMGPATKVVQTGLLPVCTEQLEHKGVQVVVEDRRVRPERLRADQAFLDTLQGDVRAFANAVLGACQGQMVIGM